MGGGASGLQKLLHLADARQAFEAGDVAAALTEVDAVIALDSEFAAARVLREEIVAHKTPPPVPESAKPLPKPRKRVAIPVAVALTLSVAGLAAVAYERGRSCIQCRVPQAVVAAGIGDISLPSATPIQTIVAAPPVEPPANTGPDWTSSRLTRLHARPQWRAAAVDVPDAVLLRDLGEGVRQLWIGTIPDQIDALFVGGTPDEIAWTTWRGALKPGAVVWRIAPQGLAIDDGVADAAAAAGFVRKGRVGYTRGYVAEQYALTHPTR